MNRRDFMGLFGKALAGVAIVPGVAGSVGLPIDIEDDLYPVSLKYMIDMDYKMRGAPAMAAELRFSNGQIKRHTIGFGPDFAGQHQAVVECAKPILQDWAAQTCRECCGVPA